MQPGEVRKPLSDSFSVLQEHRVDEMGFDLEVWHPETSLPHSCGLV
jgi:hypothetical protein